MNFNDLPTDHPAYIFQKIHEMRCDVLNRIAYDNYIKNKTFKNFVNEHDLALKNFYKSQGYSEGSVNGATYFHISINYNGEKFVDEVDLVSIKELFNF